MEPFGLPYLRKYLVIFLVFVVLGNSVSLTGERAGAGHWLSGGEFIVAVAGSESADRESSAPEFPAALRLAPTPFGTPLTTPAPSSGEVVEIGVGTRAAIGVGVSVGVLIVGVCIGICIGVRRRLQRNRSGTVQSQRKPLDSPGWAKEHAANGGSANDVNLAHQAMEVPPA
ncbi:hypothetical protein F1559_000906 [Cyanidiococcus yangmingshanensis]|uniref:Transmembrane protein n=1 Tax=Cyanidiococcus yangmingshanensis TaxID=2690220 RepID=A0A7J7IG92_9RHOD|nr:hypothetical protein F1559_000906 [Cyanidiococcus yangmingshanensis]